MAAESEAEQFKVQELRTERKDGQDDVREMLQRLADDVKPLMQRHKWTVGLLSEFSPPDPNHMGKNVNKGEEVCLRVRLPENEMELLSHEELVGSMLHQLIHNEEDAHNSNFYKLLDEVTEDFEDLMIERGHGEAAEGLSESTLSEERQKVNQLTPCGPSRFGSSSPFMQALPPSLAATLAAERRTVDEEWCITIPSKDLVATQSANSATKGIEEAVGPSGKEQYDKAAHRQGCPATSEESDEGSKRTEAEKPSDSVNKQKSGWSCKTCTLLNTPNTSSCEACGSPKAGTSIDSDKQPLGSLTASTLKAPTRGFLNPNASEFVPKGPSSSQKPSERSSKLLFVLPKEPTESPDKGDKERSPSSATTGATISRSASTESTKSSNAVGLFKQHELADQLPDDLLFNVDSHETLLPSDESLLSDEDPTPLRRLAGSEADLQRSRNIPPGALLDRLRSSWPPNEAARDSPPLPRGPNLPPQVNLNNPSEREMGWVANSRRHTDPGPQFPIREPHQGPGPFGPPNRRLTGSPFEGAGYPPPGPPFPPRGANTFMGSPNFSPPSSYSGFDGEFSRQRQPPQGGSPRLYGQEFIKGGSPRVGGAEFGVPPRGGSPKLYGGEFGLPPRGGSPNLYGGEFPGGPPRGGSPRFGQEFPGLRSHKEVAPPWIGDAPPNLPPPGFDPQVNLQETVAAAVDVLAREFPQFSAESLADILYANNCDLTLTMEMLTQLELQEESGAMRPPPQLPPSRATPSLTPTDFPALSGGDHPANPRQYPDGYGGAPPGPDFAAVVRKQAANRDPWQFDGPVNDPPPRRAAPNFNTPRGPPPQTPWLETGQAVSALYSELREEARDHARIRNACFEQATAAYLSGNKALAKSLSYKGQWHNDRMKEAHARAAEEILKQRNQGASWGGAAPPSGPRMLDLHGLHVAEALSVLKRELAALRAQAARSRQRQQIYVCVGTGHHTRGARTPARLPISVERYLQEEERVQFTEPQPGLLRVLV